MTVNEVPWYAVSNVDEIDSPALLIYPDRVEENIRRMIALAGGASRLCPHVKTHKLGPLIELQLKLGITKFKCATIAEAEMVAGAGAPDVLLAYQPVGPKLTRLIQLAKRYPRTKFSALVDNESVARSVSAAAQEAKMKIPLLIDIDCGMNRSGISAGKEAFALYQLLSSLPGVQAGGLHVYDGHIADPDPAERSRRCDAAFAPAAQLHRELLQAGLSVPRLIAGGTPTFPMHAARKEVECSPGTCVLWDDGYGTRCKDLNFLNAALVLTRVVSKPTSKRLCLDLGHKSIAAENPHPRVNFINLPEAKAVVHSEEHLVVETESAEKMPIGTCLYGIPWHICPTVALHSEAVIVENNCAIKAWSVEARKRKLTV